MLGNPEHGKNLADFFRISCESGRGITFINGENDEHFISYKELFQLASGVLANLQARGIKKGEELVLQLEENKTFLCVFWACIFGGIIPVPVSVGNNAEQRLKLFRIFERLHAPYLITDKKTIIPLMKFASENNLDGSINKLDGKILFVEELEGSKTQGVLHQAEPGEIAFVQFSSGSTGTPKGVVLTHENIITDILSMKRRTCFTGSDSLFSWMPLTHDMGIIGFHIGPLICDVNQYLMPTAVFIRHPALWMKKAHEHKVTVLSSPNFGYQYFLMLFKPETASGWDLSHVRLIMNGAEPISADLCNEFLNRMKEFGLRRTVMYTVYGLAEASLAACFPPIDEEFRTWKLDRKSIGMGQTVREGIRAEHPDDVVTYVDEGFPIDCCSVRICDAEHNEVPENTVGNIQIKGGNVTSGYYNDEEATRQALTEDGWLGTGDLGFMRKGRLVVTGRVKDILIVGGLNYYAHDIERVAQEINGAELGKTAVCSVFNHASSKEEILLFVLFKKKPEEFVELSMALRRHIRKKIGLEISHVIPVRDIPKTTSGKVQRFLLAERHSDGEYAQIISELEKLTAERIKEQKPAGKRLDVENALSTIIRQVLNEDEIGIHDNLIEAGGNSLLLSKVYAKVEELYPGRVTMPDLFANPTVSMLAGFIENKGDRKPCAADTGGENRKTGPEAGGSKDIAIIGMYARMPMAEDIDEFWNNIVHGVECVRDFPEGRRNDLERYLRYTGEDIENIRYLEGAYLEDIDRFDPSFFRISPKEASLMNPLQRMFLETAYGAAEDAGYGGRKLAGSGTGVYLGMIGDLEGYKYKQMVRDTSASVLPVSAAGNLSSAIPGRISFFLDLKGPSMLVDTACSSTLAAVDLACQGLKNGMCGMAIAGGIRIAFTPVNNENEKIGIESSDDRTRVYDESSDGSGIGEGCAAVILKPLEAAVKDGDHIYALIKGSAVNQDGHSLGITAPNPAAQTEVIEKAWLNAGIKPETISYIETHGTGTRLGDVIEIEGLRNAFRKYTDRRQFCAIGSVKANIGHLYECAGLAGLIKAVMALKNGCIPPNILFNEPNKEIKFEDSPVYLNMKPREWIPGNAPRRCGVSSFGLSGTNCHVVLEEYRGDSGQSKARGEKFKLLALSARSLPVLQKLAVKYVRLLEEEKGLVLEDICHTANTGRGHYNYRIAVIALSADDLLCKLKRLTKTGIDMKETKDIFYGEHRVVPEECKEKSPSVLTGIEKAKLSLRAAEIAEKYMFTGECGMDVLTELSRLYVSGADVPWEILTEKGARKIRLPVYPYERNRCWIEIPESVKKPEKIPEASLYYGMKWKRKMLQEAPANSKEGAVLIFVDSRIGEGIAAAFAAEGREVITVEAGEAFESLDKNRYRIGSGREDYAALFSCLENRHVFTLIHLWMLEARTGADSPEALRHNLNLGVMSLYFIIRELSRRYFNRNISMTVISGHAYSVTGEEEVIIPENAAAAGLSAVIAKECSWIRSRVIDIERSMEAEALFGEICVQSENEKVAYRNGSRFTEEFGEQDPAGFEDQPAKLRTDGVCVITGGLGGIGMEISKELSNTPGMKLALMNRSALPEHSLWQKILDSHTDPPMCEKLRALLEMESMGAEIELCRADVSNQEEVEDAFEYLRSKYGRIRGVIHAAGLYGNKLISESEENEFAEILKPKVQGAWVLDRVTRKDELDFFILFSSAAAVFPAIGQGGYIAANSYLDAFSAYRNKQGKRTLAIQWSTWKETGMAARSGFNQDFIFKAMATSRMIQGFNQLLWKNAERVLIGELNFDKDKIFLLERSRVELSESIKRRIGECRKARRITVRSRTGEVPGELRLTGENDGRYSDTEKKLAEWVRDLMGYNEINVHDNFFEIGADSITIKKLHGEIERIYPEKVKIADIFSYPTVSKLAGFILDGNKTADAAERNRENELEQELDRMLGKMEKGNISFDQFIEDVSKI